MSSIIKCDPRARARCPFKNPCCSNEDAYFMDGSDCDRFNQSVLVPPPTNADRIRAMSDEEIADAIVKNSYYPPCDMCVPKKRSIHSDHCDGHCISGVKRWLQQPAEGE